MPAKKRCQLQGETPCNSAVLRIVGQCPHCRMEFCGTHRLPEHHACNNLESCRQQAFEKNKLKLESERTVASKMGVA
ncbi:nuclear protein [Punctularia strigosozonata HHB-11173 SS5]|uniref:nuclear protein n=1 Tax=Punctularia strigosozonata (strain HHB-11173) TaxID=741275 RepID=UPI0004416957|nr:nuclear protein [Punctularia strigosozonata HHB-11173 SS5]EIN07476.1 nuclear protein [Punctularia strigosozonata HHB-11173 SS5]